MDSYSTHQNKTKMKDTIFRDIEFKKYWLLYPMQSMGESIGIGLEASSTSTGPQAKPTEPMDSTKVTYCSIQLG